jgi:hypothetical protein
MRRHAELRRRIEALAQSTDIRLRLRNIDREGRFGDFYPLRQVLMNFLRSSPDIFLSDACLLQSFIRAC